MSINNRMKHFYMLIAENCSSMSRAIRLQVGAIIVKDENIISFSWNGTPRGWDNTCEDKVCIDEATRSKLTAAEIYKEFPFIEKGTPYKLKTKPEVLHAERNALDKLAKSHESGLGSSMFTTHAPCLECAKSIYGVGIKEVYYKHDYRTTEGIEFLKKCGITVEQIEENNGQ